MKINFRLLIGILAFAGLTVLNFTQSETCFVNKALASSSSVSSDGDESSSGSTSSTTSSTTSNSTSSSSSSSSSKPYCHSGGPGSRSCSIQAGTSLGSFGVSGGCGVECDSGYYSCCGLSCTCVKM